MSALAAPPVSALHELSVRLGAFTLGPLDLELRAGEVLCLVGPNGAGKSTLLRALLGLVPLSSGSARLFGAEPRDREAAMLRRLGVVPDDPEELVDEITAVELWNLHAIAHARVGGDPAAMLDRAHEIAALLDFDPPDKPIAGFSHGMRKKTQLTAALLHGPELLVLDEPRNGLDPIGIERLEQLVRDERDRGTSILTATHDLRWAERIADRVGVLSHGRLVALDRTEALLEPGEQELADAFFRLIEARP